MSIKMYVQHGNVLRKQKGVQEGLVYRSQAALVSAELNYGTEVL